MSNYRPTFQNLRHHTNICKFAVYFFLLADLAVKVVKEDDALYQKTSAILEKINAPCSQNKLTTAGTMEETIIATGIATHIIIVTECCQYECSAFICSSQVSDIPAESEAIIKLNGDDNSFAIHIITHESTEIIRGTNLSKNYL